MEMMGKMRTFWKRLRVFTFYRKIVVSFLVISVVFVSFISLLLYVVFDHSLKREIQYISESSLIEADTTLLNMYEYLFPFVSDILSLPYIDSALYGSGINRLHEFYLLNELRRMQTSYNHVFAISLVNFDNERLLGTTGVVNGYDPAIYNALEGTPDRGMRAVRRTSRRNINVPTSPKEDVISFIYHPSGIYSDGVIVIDISEAYFFQQLNPLGAESSDRTFILTDSGEQFGGGAASFDLDPEELPGSDDYIIEAIDGSMRMVTSIPSRVLGWTLVRVMPLVNVTPFADSFGIQLIAVIGLLIAVDLCISAVLITRLYHPVKSLIGEYTEQGVAGNGKERKAAVDELKVLYNALTDKSKMAEASQKRNDQFLGNIWVKGLLFGDPEIVRQAVELHPNSDVYKGRFFCVAVMTADRMAWYRDAYDTGERGLHDFIVSNMLGELLSDYLAEPPIRIDENTLAVLLSFPDGALPGSVRVGLQEFQSYLAKYFKFTVSIGIGSTTAEWEGVAKSRGDAQCALRYRFYEGISSLLYYKDIPAFNPSPEYPHQAEKKLREAVLLRSFPKAEKALSGFIRSVAAFDEQSIRGYCERCMNDLQSKLAEAGSIVPKYTALHEKTARAENLPELESVLKDYLSFIFKALEGEAQSGHADNHPVALAKAYIDEHYDDANLSVEYLAGMVGLSPTYFGKLFHNAMRVSCVEYMIDVRMAAAAKLLLETNSAVRSISERVGLSSINYFYILFKKKYGVTPIQYRKAKAAR